MQLMIKQTLIIPILPQEQKLTFHQNLHAFFFSFPKLTQAEEDQELEADKLSLVQLKGA